MVWFTGVVPSLPPDFSSAGLVILKTQGVFAMKITAPLVLVAPLALRVAEIVKLFALTLYPPLIRVTVLVASNVVTSSMSSSPLEE